VFEAALRLVPTDVNAHRGLARCYEETGQKDAANAQLDKVASMQGSQGVADRLALARRLVDEKKFDDAEKQLLLVVDADPANVPALLAIATIRMDRGDDPGAIPHLDAALKADPSNWRAAWKRGIIEARAKNYEAADKWLALAAKGEPKEGMIWKQLGMVRINLKRRADATAALKKAKTLLPSDPEIDGLIERANAPDPPQGKGPGPAGRNGSAATTGNGAGTSGPGSGTATDAAQTLADEGSACFEKQDLECARDRYAKAIAINAEEPILYYNLGVVQAQLELGDEAKATFLSCTDKFPDNAPCWFGLGSIHAALGNTADAKACLKKLQALDPALAKDLKKQLGK
jgi:tetratricopeptide (TPR) repeat protein